MEEFKTVFLAVMSGVFIYIITEWVKEYFFVPVQKYKEIKQKIAYALIYYACYYSNPIALENLDKQNPDVQRALEGSYEIRKLAAELGGFIETLRLIKIGIPSKKKLYSAQKELIGLSNSFTKTKDNLKADRVSEQVSAIKKDLKMYEKR